MNNQTDLAARKIKIIMLGDSGVGKTSIIQAIRDTQYNPLHDPTIGIDFYSKTVEKNGVTLKLQFWDTAGQQRFRCIIPAYLKSSKIGIIVYDFSDQSSVHNLQNWIQLFVQNAPSNAQVFVVGNKVDLKQSQMEEFSSFTQKGNIKYFQVSARTRKNIPELIENIKDCLFQKLPQAIGYSCQDKNYYSKQYQLIKEKSCCFKG